MSYKTKSVKKCKNRTIKTKRIYPQDSPEKTVEFVLDAANALKLAKNLLVLACDTEANGDILVTGHKKHDQISVLRYLKYQTGERKA